MRQYRGSMKTYRTRASNQKLSKVIALLCVLVYTSLSYQAIAAPASSVTSLEGPDVTIIASEERVIYEYRQNGQLRLVRIVPAWGKPYYLVPGDPTKGFGDLERVDSLLPSWKLFEF